jgi:hypothetical protein
MTRRRALVTLSLALLVAAGLVGLGRATAPDPAAASSRGYRDGFRDGRAEGLQEGRGLAETAPLPTAAHAAARAAFDTGYRAGANDAFGGWDGGWSPGQPYVIVLAKGSKGITYRIAARTLCPPAPPTTSGTGLLVCQPRR